MKFKIGCTALLLLSVAGAIWTAGAPTWSFRGMLQPVCWFVIFFALYAVVVNARAMLDWLEVRTPPIVEDPVLGPLTYHNRGWRTAPGRKPSFRIEGRRHGPDPELVAAGADAARRIGTLEPHARALAAAGADPRGALPEDPGAFVGLTARHAGRGPGIEVVLSFATANDDGDVIDVAFVGDTLVEIDRH